MQVLCVLRAPVSISHRPDDSAKPGKPGLSFQFGDQDDNCAVLGSFPSPLPDVISFKNCKNAMAKEGLK